MYNYYREKSKEAHHVLDETENKKLVIDSEK